jgi:hypothetical protein
MHPNLMQELVAIRQADLLAEADRERLIRSARKTTPASADHLPVRRLIAVVAVLLVLIVGADLAGAIDLDQTAGLVTKPRLRI